MFYLVELYWIIILGGQQMKKISLDKNKDKRVVKYALRKYSFGVVSVAVSVCFFTEIAAASISINESKNTVIQEEYSASEDLN